jgi:hypothetical protein
MLRIVHSRIPPLYYGPMVLPAAVGLLVALCCLMPQATLGGHYAPVVDACWAADGGCVLSVSTDQTARMMTQLTDGGRWCEVARPQVRVEGGGGWREEGA